MSIKIKKYVIEDTKISKELSGYRIALFSDTHDAFSGDKVKLLIDALDKTRPDVVLFTGDGVNAIETKPEPKIEFDNTLETFKALAEKFPIYYITGNHERRIKKHSDNNKSGLYEEIISSLKSFGVNILANETVILEDGKIKLFGLDLPLDYYYIKHLDLKKNDIDNMVGKSDENAFNILLSHSPIFFDEYVKWGADLTLCGHMHGGLIRLPIVGGVLSPYRRFFPKYDYGYFEKNNKKMIVTSGVGDHNVRERISNPFEVCQIELKSKEQS